jgi:hypothetical protein
MTEDEAMAMVVRGFVEPIAKELPDGVRPGAQPADRAADGRRGRLVTELTAAVEGSSLAAANKGELFASFDVDAFEVPHGRDELWRFTPLRRLRGLHDGSAPATGNAQITVSEQPGVQIETVRRGDERLGQGGVPADRVAAQAFSSFNSATVVTVGRDTQVVAPVNITVTGPGQGAVAYGHLQIRVEELGEAVVVVDNRGSGTYADNLEFVVADAARLTVRVIADWADDAGSPQRTSRQARQGRVLRHVTVALGGEVVRLGGPRLVLRLRRRRRSCGPVFRRRRPAPRVEAAGRTTLNPIAGPRAVQRVRCKGDPASNLPDATRLGR